MPPKRSAVARQHRGDALLVGDVDRDRERLAGTSATVSSAASPSTSATQTFAPSLGEEERRLAAHPAAGARDHADLAVEPSHQASVERNTFLTSE